MTRGQMAAFLIRALGYTDDGGGNQFTDDNGHVFEGAIEPASDRRSHLPIHPPANTKFLPRSAGHQRPDGRLPRAGPGIFR